MTWLWHRKPSRGYEEAKAAYEEAKLAMRLHIQSIEAQNKDLQAKLLELLEPGITARLAPRPVRLVKPLDETQAAIERQRKRPVSLPGYEPEDETA